MLIPRRSWSKLLANLSLQITIKDTGNKLYTGSLNYYCCNSSSVLYNNNETKRHFSLSNRNNNNSSSSSQLSLQDTKVRQYIEKLALTSDETLRHNPMLQNIIQKINDKFAELEELKILAKDNEEFKEIAKNDAEKINQELLNLENEFFDNILEPEPLDNNDAVLEIKAGVGGQEAMLFALDLFKMYQNFASYHGLEFTITEYSTAEGGGLRTANAAISGRGVYQKLKFEGGVHRVQRIPKTERAGRIHTSTATVAILPLPTEVQVNIQPSDLKFEAKKASGAGGQHVNTTESAVRLTHFPTGIVVECQMERSQIRNREIAVKMLRAKIYDRQIEAQSKSIRNKRKLQVGTSGRSEKIRTYNFVQDRVTDHRIGLTVHNIKGIIEGKDDLNDLVNQLLEYDHDERIAQLFS